MKDSVWYSSIKEGNEEFTVVKYIDYLKLQGNNFILESKINKLKQLMILTDPVVSSDGMNDIALIQWNEYIKCFPEEG